MEQKISYNSIKNNKRLFDYTELRDSVILHYLKKKPICRGEKKKFKQQTLNCFED